jgi:cytochrome b involved in lipid metabolism
MWFINGKQYDLSNFKHPGGPVALSLAEDRDATQLFKSYHPFTNAELVLKKYEVTNSENTSSSTEIEEPVFDWSAQSEFWQEMKAAVEPVLKRTGTKATFNRWIHIAVMTLVTILLFKPFVNGYWLTLFAFPLALWTLAVNSLHDACHFALSHNWKVNLIVSYLFPWFTSPTCM